ncbi:hypothetical protein SUGI_0250960 [Cryptomeria japonica]|nr:hypothetical protein SUGI_0250960 [Cryptomeria japonica]
MDMSNKDGDNTCPLCTEEMGWINMQFKPCESCGYQLCIWCWFRVVEVAEADCTKGRCPHCRTHYDKEKVIQMLLNLASPTDTQNKSQKLNSNLFRKLRMFSLSANKNKEVCKFSASVDCTPEASGRNSDSSRNGGFRKAVCKLGRRLERKIIEKCKLVTSGWRKIKKPS